ncbi:PREDICTED: protein ROOT HAIR DEFECTIVE 3 homolog 2-like [Prunus mume]|uniref:Protein ROOT HAIR DEFECTIVE 3 homolog 2-like n=1 Tax=Prunus mume TaxID=102107 RepID=A0ABM0NJN1_PRUMU|nr:PREDICTED: protein ROOT HAIR DEFECTIVE 3 homolog 2-like [Prunus mume]
MVKDEDCCATHLIDGDGEFNVAGVDSFVKKVKLAECGIYYVVVAIMGPQSSGKSTLLNHLFRTNFREMDACDGRSRTTKGVWIAKCVGIEPCTIAIDLEGTDGRGRGENVTFEKQSALFALAISDIVLINMWCNDVGREHAANKPLLRTVFEMMMRIFSPRKRTLLFVIRDTSLKTPFEKLEFILREDIQKIWDAVARPQAHKSTLLSDIFNVEVVALSSYEYQEEKFIEEVAQLRQRFSNTISQGGLAGDRSSVIPASGFSLSAQQIWKVIKENRDLNLPNHKVMVATIRCGEIATQKFNQLMENRDWLALQQVAAQSGPVQGSGKRLRSILDAYLSEYDMETMDFDEGVRNSTRKQLLESKAFYLVHAAYATILEHLRSLEEFKVKQSFNEEGLFDSSASTSTTSFEASMPKFRQGCADATMQKANLDSSIVGKKLLCDKDADASHSAKLSELKVKYENQLSTSLTEKVDEALLEDGGKDVWALIRDMLKFEVANAISTFSTELDGFQLDEETISKMKQNLMNCARNEVEKNVRGKADEVLTLMKKRFESVFNYDSDLNPRVWAKKKVIKTATKDAHSASLKLLAVLAVIRLNEMQDDIENVLFSSCLKKEKKKKDSIDPLASRTWNEVSSEDTLITPLECKKLWNQFIKETKHHVQEANKELKARNKWLCSLMKTVPEVIGLVLTAFACAAERVDSTRPDSMG